MSKVVREGLWFVDVEVCCVQNKTVSINIYMEHGYSTLSKEIERKLH